MAVVAALYVVLFAANLPQATPQSTNSFPIGDVRNCPVTQRWGNDAPLYRITALPGSGFDNLRNLDMGEVFFFNYSTCKISNDGKYLLPDGISLSPILESKIDMYSEFFDHWDNYTSMTSFSINLEMGTFFSQIGGKFSFEYGTIESRQVNDNSKTACTLIKSRLYTVKVQPDSQLHPAFKWKVSVWWSVRINISESNHWCLKVSNLFYTTLHGPGHYSVCVSVDVEQGSKYSIPFAGFDSCEIGNPFAITGYTQHMITVDNGCKINYCILAGGLNGRAGLLPPQLPPFSPVPQSKFNMTRTLVVGEYDGGIWVKGQDGTWSKSAQGGTGGLQKLADTNHTASCNSTSTSTAPLSQDNAGSSSGMLEGVGETSGAPSSSELSSGEVVAASVGSLVGAGIIIAMMLLFGKLIYRKYTKPQSIPDSQSVGGAHC
eukprot:Em0002g1072a